MSEAKKLCIDLCSGLGGLSEAFIDAGWKVYRLDNDPKFLKIPNTRLCDITDQKAVNAILAEYIELDEDGAIDAVVCSPPCQRFSLACRTWPKPGIQRAMEITGACLEIIATYKPRFWILENPKARLRWFLGTPKGTIRLSDYGAPYLKPTDYWGNIDLPMLEKTTPPKMHLRPMKHDMKSPSPIYLSGSDSALRAKMPYEFSKAILEAVS